VFTAIFNFNVNILQNTNAYWEQVKNVLMETFQMNGKKEMLACA